MNDYVQALLDFVNREYDAQTIQVLELWQQPIGRRVAEGEAVADIEVVHIEPQRAWLRCSENQSKFRPGDVVRLNQGNPLQSPCFACELEEDRGTDLVVRAGYRVGFNELAHRRGWVLDRDIVDVRFLLESALAQLDDGSQHSQCVSGILQGRVRPSFDSDAARSARAIVQHLELDGSQAEAFVQAFSTRTYYLIQGPPGTGKTYLLAYLAEALAQRGERVLVTAFTHRAINNALRKICEVTGFRRTAKIGQRLRADDLTWGRGQIPNYEHLSDSPFDRGDTGFIVGGTCFALRTRRLRDVTFDTVIFDEAGQVTLPLAVAGMLAGRRHIFIGDHKQMRPVVVADHTPKWVARSVFETLFERTPGSLLTTTYRMNAEVNAYPSQRFYGGLVYPSSDAHSRRLELGGRPGAFGALLMPTPSSIFVEVGHSGRGMRSPEEAAVAAGVVAEAVSRGLPPTEIAVVAPYRAQVRLIREALRSRNLEPSGDGVIVDTVERIQGQERQVVVVSLTTSDPGHAAQRASFYFQPNRLNVAITRPRVKRIVIGSPRLFDARPKDAEHQRWVENFRGLYESSHVFVAK
ncbi:MAG: AAA family ATPase [Anaerolineae bacterium]|nr:AAA family ATPase [Anaerolineae bacterium]